MTAADGSFEISARDVLSVEATHGYRREERRIADIGPGGEIRLSAVRPKAVFLSMATLIRPAEVDTVLALPAHSEVNALVIDVKNKEGAISVRGSLHDDLQVQSRLTVRSAALVKVMKHANNGL